MTEKRTPRVLVVNDTQEILELFNQLLGDLGHEVSLMSFAPNELSRIRDEAPDLIIVAFVLGGAEKSGWQLIQKLKMDRDTERLPIIVCTAAVHEVREQEGYLTEQGVVVLLKPFGLDQLDAALDKAFELGAHAVGTAPTAAPTQSERSGSRNGAGRQKAGRNGRPERRRRQKSEGG